LGRRSPVAAIERLRALEENRYCDHSASTQRELDHQRFGHRARGLAEECPRQVGLMPVAQERVAVQGIDAIEQRFSELTARARLEIPPRLGDAAAFAPRLLALFGGEGGEIVLEARVAAIGPVELTITSQQPAAPRTRGACRLIEEQGVHAG